ncbi:hypothetical protein BdWA1_000629 [Babesia duncani]|uniref:Uncharacterized protein n=1 Tax=Babesia duncani TaxID=323732 RepID=A0AAD9PMI1_9APIC|nr:hypothetical protein BdWA1_003955 [Babesia duncani]KAK2197626.1 hypothetical protein BdWA1_000629 [Babesia duncani]
MLSFFCFSGQHNVDFASIEINQKQYPFKSGGFSIPKKSVPLFLDVYVDKKGGKNLPVLINLITDGLDCVFATHPSQCIREEFKALEEPSFRNYFFKLEENNFVNYKLPELMVPFYVNVVTKNSVTYYHHSCSPDLIMIPESGLEYIPNTSENEIRVNTLDCPPPADIPEIKLLEKRSGEKVSYIGSADNHVFTKIVKRMLNYDDVDLHRYEFAKAGKDQLPSSSEASGSNSLT